MTSITILYDTIRLEEKLLIESAKKNNITIEILDKNEEDNEVENKLDKYNNRSEKLKMLKDKVKKKTSITRIKYKLGKTNRKFRFGLF